MKKDKQKLPFRLITVKEAAEMMNTSYSTLLRWIDEGSHDLPKPFKVGRMIKFRDDEIEHYIESRRVFNGSYLFLDIDGVINNPLSYALFHDDMDNYKDSTYHVYFDNIKKDGNKQQAIDALKEINSKGEFMVGLFANEKHHGEIYNKLLVKMLSNGLKETYPDTKVILISSASDVIESELFDKAYWSELWGLNIVDGFALAGDGMTRYNFMKEYLKKLPENEMWRATMLDDLDCPDEVEYGYFEVSTHFTIDTNAYKRMVSSLFDYALTPTRLNRLEKGDL